MEGLCALVTSGYHINVKSGRQLLEKYSCQGEPQHAKDGSTVVLNA